MFPIRIAFAVLALSTASFTCSTGVTVDVCDRLHDLDYQSAWLRTETSVHGRAQRDASTHQEVVLEERRALANVYTRMSAVDADIAETLPGCVTPDLVQSYAGKAGEFLGECLDHAAAMDKAASRAGEDGEEARHQAAALAILDDMDFLQDSIVHASPGCWEME